VLHRHLILIFAPIIVVILASGPAAGASAADAPAPPGPPVPASAVTLSEEGITLYQAGRYRPALEKFLQAYAIEPDPNLLFNIARCDQALGDTKAALENYRSFVADPAADPFARPRANAAIEALSLPQAPAAPSQAEDSSAPAPDRRQLVPLWVATGLLTSATILTGLLALDSADSLRRERATFPGDAAELGRRASQTTALTLSADALGLASLTMAALSAYWTVGRRSPAPKLSAGITRNGLVLTRSF